MKKILLLALLVPTFAQAGGSNIGSAEVRLSGTTDDASQRVCLSKAQILNELRQMAAESGYRYRIGTNSEVSVISGGFPIAAFFEDIDNRSAFRKAGLALNAEDIANARTVGELAGIIRWNLCR